jgi:hypothetical protein
MMKSCAAWSESRKSWREIVIRIGLLLCFLLAGCCSSDARRDAASRLAVGSEQLSEAWEIYRAATVSAPDLGGEARELLPDVERKITEAISEMRQAAIALAREDGAGGE